MIKKTLSTGRKVEIKIMPQNDISHCEDITDIHYEHGQPTTIKNSSKAKTAWIRKGLNGGDFEATINGSVPDEVFREMTQGEQDELRILIQESQYMGEKKPSPSD